MTWRSALKPEESSILWAFEALTFLKSKVKISLQRACLLKVHTKYFWMAPCLSYYNSLFKTRQRKY